MSGIITRQEQLNLLIKGINCPLTLIVAAPGSGKSYLLEQLYNARQPSIANEPDHIVRIDIVSRMDDGYELFKRLLNELKKIAPLWEASFFNLFNAESLPESHEVLEVMQAALARLDSKVVIVLDDFHLIRTEENHQIVNAIIRTLPSNISFVIASRMYPLFSLSRLKLEEKIFVIDGNDLRLSSSEIVVLNQKLGGAPLTADKLSGLLEQTEGWFVGVKLALLAYSQSGDVALNTFNGSQPELVNYFGHEVLKNISPEWRHFVLSTALFERFNVGLCEQVLGIEECISILENVVARELFLVPMPFTDGYYRYHPLLQAFLQRQLELEHGKQYILSLHRKTASYLLTLGEYDAAIRHAGKTEDSLYFYEVLKSACDKWLRLGEFERVMETLCDLDEAVINQHTELLVITIYTLIFTRRFNQAHYYLEILKAQCAKYDPKTAPTDKRNPQSIDEFVGHLLLLFQREDDALSYPLMDNYALQHQDLDIKSLSMLISAYEKMYKGEIAASFRMANQAKTLFEKTGYKFLESFSELLIILCDRYLGRGADAAKRMLTLYRQVANGPKNPVWVNLASGMMVVYYEKNELDEAFGLCETLLPRLNFTCATEVVANVYLYFSRLLHIRGDKSKASRLLIQLERILSLGNFDRFQSQVVQELIRQALNEGKFTVAENLFNRYRLDTVCEGDAFDIQAEYREKQERYALAAVYWLMEKGRLNHAERVLTQLALHLDHHGIQSRGLIAKANLAIISMMRGDIEGGISQLKLLIEHYGFVGFSRSVFDESPGLNELFKTAIKRQRLSLPDYFLLAYGNELSLTIGDVSEVEPHKLLTGKELEIFELLSTGLSNADISKRANIAVSTTKWHLKNIYMKLGVDNRSSAIMLAHQK